MILIRVHSRNGYQIVWRNNQLIIRVECYVLTTVRRILLNEIKSFAGEKYPEKLLLKSIAMVQCCSFMQMFPFYVVWMFDAALIWTRCMFAMSLRSVTRLMLSFTQVDVQIAWGIFENYYKLAYINRRRDFTSYSSSFSEFSPPPHDISEGKNVLFCLCNSVSQLLPDDTRDWFEWQRPHSIVSLPSAKW